MGSLMRVDVLRKYRPGLARSAAVLALAGFVAGCSSDVARFDDSFYTGAIPRTPTPRAAMGAPQAYPGDLDQTNTGSVNRGGNGVGMPGYGSNPGAGVQSSRVGDGGSAPARAVRTASVERAMLAPPSGAASPSPTYAEPPAMPASTAAAAPATAAPSKGDSTKAGWSNSGNLVTLKNGETVETLSNRYGVPVKAILTANGMTSAAEAQPGQQISIPTYSYGGSPSSVRTAASGKSGQTLGAPPAPLRVPSGASPAAAPGGSVVVASGDSLSSIARRTGVSVAELRAANGIADDKLRIGQTLALPKGASQPARAAAAPAKSAEPAVPETRTAAATAEPKPYEAPRPAATAAPQVQAAPVGASGTSLAVEAENDVATAAPAGTGIDQFRWPVQGRVTKRYGDKSGARRNDGVDISVPRGTPVKAAENGVVIYAGDGLKEFGNTVLVKHDNGLVTVYGYADELKVKRGATVRRGQEIATAGVSVDAGTPMVHFEVRKNSAPVDPMTYLK